MKLVTYRLGDVATAGVVIGDDVFDLATALGIPAPLTVGALLRERGADLAGVEKAMTDAVTAGQAPAVAYADAQLAAPVTDPGKVLCIGLNYADHVAETGRKLPEYPDVFTKFATSLIGPFDEIGALEVTDNLDFEAELAIVIGRTASKVSAADALDYVAGAMVLNDVTARDIQYRGTQWTMGKAVDASTPSGPALVTLDEVGDLQTLEISCHLNGVEMQHSNTRHMIFPIATIIEYISRTLTLEPGDIIATGTPDGIGAKRTPAVWMQAGDRVTVTVERVGQIESVIAAR